MRKIARCSSFDKDWFNEEFILWPMQEEYARQIADALNKDSGETGEYYYRVVDLDYQLYIGMEP